MQLRPTPLVPLLTLLLAAAAALPAADVEIRLKTGERVFGALISDDGGSVVIDRRVATRSGSIATRADYPRERIAEIEPVASLDALYQKRAAQSPDTFEGQFALAKWCADRGLAEHAFTHAKRVNALDPQDQVGMDLLEELGYARDDDGQWIKQADYAAKHGMVIHDGKMMTPAQVELFKSAAKSESDRSDATAKQRSLDGAVATVERRIADIQSRMDKAREQQQALKNPPKPANQQGGGRNGRNGGQNQGQNQQQPQQNPNEDRIKQLDKVIADLQKSLETAQQDLSKAKDAQAKGKQALDDAQKAAESARKAANDSMPSKDAKDAKDAPADGKDAKDSADAKPAADKATANATK